MNSLVTLLFVLLWSLVGFFMLRWLGMRYFREPRRADVAALAAAAAFTLGSFWPYSTRPNTSVTETASPISALAAPAQQVVASSLLGAGTPLGTHDVSTACRSVSGVLRPGNDGALDDLRTDAAQSVIVADGNTIDRERQYLIEGWAAEPGERRPARGVCLLVDGRVDPSAKVFFGGARPDLAAGFHNDTVVPSGYVIVLRAGFLSSGVHRIGVVSRVSNGGLFTLPTPRRIVAR